MSRHTAENHSAYRRKEVMLAASVDDLSGTFDAMMARGHPSYLAEYHVDVADALDESVIPVDAPEDRYAIRHVREPGVWRSAFSFVFPSEKGDSFYIRYREADEQAVDAILHTMSQEDDVLIEDTAYRGHIVME